MKRTGEILRKAREGKNLSINELAISLKINSKALTAIEEGDLTKLPARTFLRGFVQSYAQALKIDQNEVLAVFAEEMGSTKPQPIVSGNPSAISSSGDMPSIQATNEQEAARPAMETPRAAPLRSRNEAKSEGLKGLEETSHLKLAILSGVSLVLILLIFGTKKVIDRYQRESTKSDVVVTTPLTHENSPAPPATAPAVTTAETPTTPSTDAATAKPAEAATADAAKPTETAKPVVAAEPPKPVEAPKAVETPAAKPAEPAKTAESQKPAKHTPSFVNRNAPVDMAPQEETPLLTSLNPTNHPPLSPMSQKAMTMAMPVMSKSEAKAVETAKAPEAAKPAETKTAETVKPAETEKTPEATKPTETAKAEETKTADAKAATPPPEEKKKKKSLELIIEAMDAVDIEYSGAKGPVQKLHLDADQVHTIKSQNGIKLTVSNAGAVNLILNGRDLGVPGGLGSPATLTY